MLVGESEIAVIEIDGAAAEIGRPSLSNILFVLRVKIVVMHPDVERLLLMRFDILDRLFGQFRRIPVAALIVNYRPKTFEHDLFVALPTFFEEPLLGLRTRNGGGISTVRSKERCNRRNGLVKDRFSISRPRNRRKTVSGVCAHRVRVIKDDR